MEEIRMVIFVIEGVHSEPNSYKAFESFSEATHLVK